MASIGREVRISQDLSKKNPWVTPSWNPWLNILWPSGGQPLTWVYLEMGKKTTGFPQNCHCWENDDKAMGFWRHNSPIFSVFLRAFEAMPALESALAAFWKKKYPNCNFPGCSPIKKTSLRMFEDHVFISMKFISIGLDLSGNLHSIEVL